MQSRSEQRNSDPAAMQRFLESQGVTKYREAAPPPIAKPSEGNYQSAKPTLSVSFL